MWLNAVSLCVCDILEEDLVDTFLSTELGVKYIYVFSQLLLILATICVGDLSLRVEYELPKLPFAFARGPSSSLGGRNVLVFGIYTETCTIGMKCLF